MRIMSKQVDTGLTWASEVRFQESIRNPIQGVEIPANQNAEAIYAGGVRKNAPHPTAAAPWLAFLKSPEAQAVYHQYGSAHYWHCPIRRAAMPSTYCIASTAVFLRPHCFCAGFWPLRQPRSANYIAKRPEDARFTQQNGFHARDVGQRESLV